MIKTLVLNKLIFIIVNMMYLRNYIDKIYPDNRILDLFYLHL